MNKFSLVYVTSSITRCFVYDSFELCEEELKNFIFSIKVNEISRVVEENITKTFNEFGDIDHYRHEFKTHNKEIITLYIVPVEYDVVVEE